MKKMIALLIVAILAFTTALAEPAQTAEPKTDADFDYESLIKDPDTYNARIYTAVGTVANAFDMFEGDPRWVHCVGAIIMVNNQLSQPVYIIYDCKDEIPIAVDDYVRFTGRFGGTMDLKTGLGIYSTVPMFVASYVDLLN